MDDRLLDALAQQRDGVLSLGDAHHLGMTRSALAEHARRRGWTRPHQGVLLPPGTPMTYRRAVLVAVRAVRNGRVLIGGETAAYLWGMVTRQPRQVTLVVSKSRNVPRLSGMQLPVTEVGRRSTVTVVVRQSRTLVQADAANRDGIPVTTPARTVIDLAATKDVDDLRSLVIDGRQRGVLRLDDIRHIHARIPRYPGRANVSHVLLDLDEDDCDSRLEWRFRREARVRGFQLYPRPFPFRCSDGIIIEIDVAFPAQWVAVECDGWGSHSERADLTWDHLRQNRAVADGWRPFRVDWTRVTQDTDRLLDELRSLLDAPIAGRLPAQPAEGEVDPRFRSRRRR